MNCVWEFGLREADGGWTAQLYPISIRPQGAVVFDFVRSGDIDSVRRLLQSGEIPLRDHEDNWKESSSLLQVCFTRRERHVIRLINDV